MQPKPLIVEFVGLPGVGKTTLVNHFVKQSSKLRIEETPNYRGIKYIPFFTKNTFLSLPVFTSIQPTKDHIWLSPRDIALMVILKGWHLTLERQRANSQQIIILDEGPICYLTRLYAFGSDALKGESAKCWWDATCKQWAKTLDLVIKLDTTDALLIQRIRSRDVPQIVKELPDHEALQYMRNHRNAQEYALSKIMSQSVSPKMLSFDTTQNLPKEMVADLIVQLAL